MIEGYKDDIIKENVKPDAIWLLKWLKLTGWVDSERSEVPLISHPAILPMYIFAFNHKLHDDVPEEYKMTIFERYMKHEIKIGMLFKIFIFLLK